MARVNSRTCILILSLLLPVTILAGISWGSVSISLASVVESLWRLLTINNEVFINNELAVTANNQLIIEQIRLPRVLLSAFTGASLAICGVVTQGLFRNSLADPSLIGVTSGASLGASIAIFTGGLMGSLMAASSDSAWHNIAFFRIGSVALGAFIGGLLATLLVYRLSTKASGTSVATMLLVGIAVTALAGGLNSLFAYISDDNMLRQISLWQMGGLNRANWLYLSISLVTLIVALSIFPSYGTALNALLLGESEARHLGFDVKKITRQLIILVALVVGIAVALTGIIGFIGLIIPHIMRLIIGPSHRNLMIASALAGAILLVCADVLSRVMISPTEIPVGIITALLGAPFFIALLRRTRMEY